jgi:hypothetical protein
MKSEEWKGEREREERERDGERETDRQRERLSCKCDLLRNTPNDKRVDRIEGTTNFSSPPRS